MATNLQTGPDTSTDLGGGPSLATLVSGIVNDAQELLRQQLALFQHEVRQDVERAKEVAISLALALPFALTGGLLLCLMLVALLHEQAHLPWWGSFGIVGGALFLISMGLGLWARQRLTTIEPTKGPAAQALKENLEWTTKPK